MRNRACGAYGIPFIRYVEFRFRHAPAASCWRGLSQFAYMIEVFERSAHPVRADVTATAATEVLLALFFQCYLSLLEVART